MLRITELRLPLDHPEDALAQALRARLGLPAGADVGITVVRRGYDARRRNDIQLVYTLDVSVPDEEAVLRRFAGDPHVKPAPAPFPMASSTAKSRTRVTSGARCWRSS